MEINENIFLKNQRPECPFLYKKCLYLSMLKSAAVVTWLFMACTGAWDVFLTQPVPVRTGSLLVCTKISVNSCSDLKQKPADGKLQPPVPEFFGSPCPGHSVSQEGLFLPSPTELKVTAVPCSEHNFICTRAGSGREPRFYSQSCWKWHLSVPGQI